ncbi:glutamate ligase domain-containing protein [Parasphaerochaeta coccoides]|uniref:UDP-N-acetylmuramate--L-alanine ligase n=1 Tax=Parasphaerochaeta coccoides (strain ATCC BAA-1237 / DSM 17374 / SPN1) TaxID=760011 RepID=F4GIJ8_PARC1|nr:cyanophycin synthetase [Parasphaerochaeta coccoides]AEC02132.1 UDP-N-acetylmuramate--L-alanine ligase [Parasphaerochaeta coccoides DSM 17374]
MKECGTVADLLAGKKVFCIGIKGTGMASLAIMMKNAGACVCGCDTAEVFMTDAILESHGLSSLKGFSADLLPSSIDIVVHSSAWTDENCPVLRRARSEVPSVWSYPGMLACLSRSTRMYAVAGTHGKTTTTGCAAWLLSLPSRRSFPFFSVFGSAVRVMGEDLPGKEPPLCGPWQGDECAVVEACEYKDHFLDYRVRGALVTSVDFDHPDFFPDHKAVEKTFRRFVLGIQPGGFLLCCTDDSGARALAAYARRHRPDLMVHGYGFASGGIFSLRDVLPHGNSSLSGGHEYRMKLFGDRVFSSRLHGRALVGDVVGGSLLAAFMVLDRPHPDLYLDEDALITDEVLPTVVGTLLRDAQRYPGCLGRTEEEFTSSDDIIFMDDYAHHPAEIRASLDSLRRKYPQRRLVVAFSPHTASRTRAFLDDFARELGKCDFLVIQGTYASARGDADRDNDGARMLCEKIASRKSGERSAGACLPVFAPDEGEAIKILAQWLMSGDLCITMGAGNNREMSRKVLLARGTGSLS